MTKDKQQLLELIERLKLGVLIIGHEPGQRAMYDDVTASQAMRKAAEAIQSLLVENERLREGLRPLADLRLPAKPQGNAGMYSLLHHHIRKARTLLGDS